MASKTTAPERVLASVEYNAKIRGVSDAELSLWARFSGRTLERRRKNPANITLGELDSIAKKMRVPVTKFFEDA